MNFPSAVRTGWNNVFALPDLISKLLAILAFAALMGQWVLMIVFLYQRAGSMDFLRLHYTVEYGIDWIGEWWKILAYPGIGLAAFFSNLAVAGKLRARGQSYALAMLFLTVVVEFALAAGGTAAILLNGPR